MVRMAPDLLPISRVVRGASSGVACAAAPRSGREPRRPEC